MLTTSHQSFVWGSAWTKSPENERPYKKETKKHYIGPGDAGMGIRRAVCTVCTVVLVWVWVGGWDFWVGVLP